MRRARLGAARWLGVALMLLVLLAASRCGDGDRPAASPPPAASVPSPSAPPAALPAASPVATAGASPAVDDSPRLAALSFLAIYTERPRAPAERAAWDRAIAALSTPDLARGLRQAAVERLLPVAEPIEAALDMRDDEAAQVRTVLDDGSPVLVTLEYDGARWLVSGVSPER